jgi:hypothetical protein
MRDSLRKFLVVSACASLLLVCSCEKHQVGEDPEFQKEKTDIGNGSEENSATASESELTATPSPKPTPAEFFPESTPR